MAEQNPFLADVAEEPNPFLADTLAPEAAADNPFLADVPPAKTKFFNPIKDSAKTVPQAVSQAIVTTAGAPVHIGLAGIRVASKAVSPSDHPLLGTMPDVMNEFIQGSTEFAGAAASGIKLMNDLGKEGINFSPETLAYMQENPIFEAEIDPVALKDAADLQRSVGARGIPVGSQGMLPNIMTTKVNRMNLNKAIEMEMAINPNFAKDPNTAAEVVIKALGGMSRALYSDAGRAAARASLEQTMPALPELESVAGNYVASVPRMMVETVGEALPDVALVFADLGVAKGIGAIGGKVKGYALPSEINYARKALDELTLAQAPKLSPVTEKVPEVVKTLIRDKQALAASLKNAGFEVSMDVVKDTKPIAQAATINPAASSVATQQISKLTDAALTPVNIDPALLEAARKMTVAKPGAVERAAAEFFKEGAPLQATVKEVLPEEQLNLLGKGVAGYRKAWDWDALQGVAPDIREATEKMILANDVGKGMAHLDIYQFVEDPVFKTAETLQRSVLEKTPLRSGKHAARVAEFNDAKTRISHMTGQLNMRSSEWAPKFNQRLNALTLRKQAELDARLAGNERSSLLAGQAKEVVESGAATYEDIARVRTEAFREAFDEAIANGYFDDIKKVYVSAPDQLAGPVFTEDDFAKALELFKQGELYRRSVIEPAKSKAGINLLHDAYMHRNYNDAVPNGFVAQQKLQREGTFGTKPNDVFKKQIISSGMKRERELPVFGSAEDTLNYDYLEMMEKEWAETLSKTRLKEAQDGLIDKAAKILSPKEVNAIKKGQAALPEGWKILQDDDFRGMGKTITKQMLVLKDRGSVSDFTRATNKFAADASIPFSELQKSDNFTFEDLQWLRVILGKRTVIMRNDLYDFLKNYRKQSIANPALKKWADDIFPSLKEAWTNRDAAGIGQRLIIESQAAVELGPKAWVKSLTYGHEVFDSKDLELMREMLEAGLVQPKNTRGLLESVAEDNTLLRRVLNVKIPGTNVRTPLGLVDNYFSYNSRVMFGQDPFAAGYTLRRQLGLYRTIKEQIEAGNKYVLEGNFLAKKADDAFRGFLRTIAGEDITKYLKGGTDLHEAMRIRQKLEAVMGSYNPHFRTDFQHRFTKNWVLFYGFNRGMIMSSLTAPARHPIRTAVFGIGLMDGLNYALSGQHLWENEEGRKFKVKVDLDSAYPQFGLKDRFGIQPVYIDPPSKSKAWLGEIELAFNNLRMAAPMYETKPWRALTIMAQTMPDLAAHFTKKTFLDQVYAIRWTDTAKKIVNEQELTKRIGLAMMELGGFDAKEVYDSVLMDIDHFGELNLNVEMAKMALQYAGGININKPASYSSLKKNYEKMRSRLGEDLLMARPNYPKGHPLRNTFWQDAVKAGARVGKGDTGIESDVRFIDAVKLADTKVAELAKKKYYTQDQKAMLKRELIKEYMKSLK